MPSSRDSSFASSKVDDLFQSNDEMNSIQPLSVRTKLSGTKTIHTIASSKTSKKPIKVKKRVRIAEITESSEEEDPESEDEGV